MQKIFKHVCCRQGFYLKTDVKRFPVPDEFINWTVDFDQYDPPNYESNVLKSKIWADPPISDQNFSPKFNELDSKYKVNRKSYTGIYQVLEKFPLNPFGRTGIKGRGILGRWGPNHAADPIVTRWKRDETGKIINNNETKKPVLQMCAIERHDCHQWAIPGGMVDPGEKVTTTLKREFMEEALSVESSSLVEEFFTSKGVEIFKGYIDDPRNTDNAWMESVAYNFHDESGDIVGNLQLNAGDDARNVKWIDIDQNTKLYASHLKIVEQVVERLNAHF